MNLDEEQKKIFLKILEALLQREDLLADIAEEYNAKADQIELIVKFLCYELIKEVDQVE